MDVKFALSLLDFNTLNITCVSNSLDTDLSLYLESNLINDIEDELRVDLYFELSTVINE